MHCLGLSGPSKNLPTIVAEMEFTLSSAEMIEKMNLYLHPESPVMFYMGIRMYRNPIWKRNKDFCQVCFFADSFVESNYLLTTFFIIIFH
jgi:hypothetical protein